MVPGSSEISCISEVGPYMLIKISGKVQAAVLCLLQTQSTMTRSAPIMMQSHRPGPH